MTQPDNPIAGGTSGRDSYIVHGASICTSINCTMNHAKQAGHYPTTQPTNSIDSELEEILDQLCIEAVAEYDWRESHIKKALQAIKALYRKEIEEALEPLGTGTIDPVSSPKSFAARQSQDQLRAELRAKLLGGKNER